MGKLVFSVFVELRFFVSSMELLSKNNIETKMFSFFDVVYQQQQQSLP